MELVLILILLVRALPVLCTPSWSTTNWYGSLVKFPTMKTFQYFSIEFIINSFKVRATRPQCVAEKAKLRQMEANTCQQWVRKKELQFPFSSIVFFFFVCAQNCWAVFWTSVYMCFVSWDYRSSSSTLFHSLGLPAFQDFKLQLL